MQLLRSMPAVNQAGEIAVQFKEGVLSRSGIGVANERERDERTSGIFTGLLA